jgi:hypothetical protein
MPSQIVICLKWHTTKRDDVALTKRSKRAGTFYTSPEKEIYGELTLAGAKSRLYLHSRENFDTHNISRCLHGTLLDLSKGSLIDCVTPPVPGSSYGDRGRYYFADVFPHFVVEGEDHLDPSEAKVIGVHFLIDDATTLFYDFDAFSMVPDARPLIDQIVRAKSHNREVTTGPDPEIFYFTGKRQIFASDTVFGAVRATHNPVIKLPGPDGVQLRNRIIVSFAFQGGIIFNEAIGRAVHLLNYFGMLVGRPQNLRGMQVELQSASDAPILLDAYWTMAPKRNRSFGEGRPHVGDILLDAVGYPELFSRVMANWLATQDTWKDARFRFFTSFAKQRRYDIDRLVGSANMFDVLPSTAVPTTVELSHELQHAKTEAKRMFEALPPTAERDSILSSLGRLGKSSLKHKVRYRAQLLIEATGTLFEDILIVTDEAVNCRNYYVHGGEPRFDYNRSFDAVVFFTETLEFVFATSDLIEAGWDIKMWSKRPKGMTHPFDRYLLNYRNQLQMLKDLLPGKKRQQEPGIP